MPTPFESRPDWSARTETPRRSVFENYRAAGTEDSSVVPPSGGTLRDPPTRGTLPTGVPPDDGTRAGLQAAIDAAVARSFLYQFLARAFEDPAAEGWAWLTTAETLAAFRSAVKVLDDRAPGLGATATALAAQLRSDDFESFQIGHVTAFGHAARGDCPPNEIEYGDLNADPLFQPHRLADLAAFYRAFGLGVADGAAERPDHIGMELEFMSVLAAREAFALEHQLDEDHLAISRDAQKKFLREHLGRWSPAFARRLIRTAIDRTLAAAAAFLRDWITTECARVGVPAGSEDLLLRTVDQAAETLCGSCGLQNLPPGAAAPGATT